MTIINTTISNAESVTFDKKRKAWTGMIKGSGSKILFDISIHTKNNSLVCELKETGSKKKGKRHFFTLEQNVHGGEPSEKTGGKLPHFVGRGSNESVAVWKSDYNSMSLFVIFNDIDEDANYIAEELLDIIDDEVNDMAQSIMESADGIEGRPDTSEAADKEALKASLKLSNG